MPIQLIQTLDTNNDSFSYTVAGEKEPMYVVDSHANLFKKGEQIGRFLLRNPEQWQLFIGDTLYMRGPENGLFKLPEFELKALTQLVNE